MDNWLARKTGAITASHLVSQHKKRKANFDH
jgi:hypothetical protein